MPATHAAAQLDEPPLPDAAPRFPVASDPPPRGYADPVKRVVDAQPAADAPKATDTETPPATEDAPEPPSTAASREERGLHRGGLLRKLEGGDVVLLESDPVSPPSVTEPLSLAEAVTFALKNNFEVAGSKAKHQASQWEFYGGLGQYVPRIEYDRRSGHARSKPASFHDAHGVVVSDDRHPTRSRSITVRQPLIDLAILTDILGRSQTLSAANAEEIGIRERVALETITSFLRLTQSRLSIGFANAYKSNLDRMSQRMRDRVSGGGASQVDLERLTARSVSARSAAIEARAEYQAAAVEFRRLTGVVPLKLAMPLNLMPAIPDSVEDVLDRALHNNPDYQAALFRVEAAKSSVAKSYAAFAPKVSLEFSDNRTWNAGGIDNELPANAAPSPVYPYSNERRIMTIVTMSMNGGVDLAQGFANAALTRQTAAQ
ncbi:MAG: TolC family protein, partial [Magnetospirillum sp.]|nr:TolC family protein [Magnetospirillum sp.]